MQNDSSGDLAASYGGNQLFKLRYLSDIRKLIEYKANVNTESAAVFIVGFVTLQIEKLSVHYGYDKVKSIIGIRDYDKKCRHTKADAI